MPAHFSRSARPWWTSAVWLEIKKSFTRWCLQKCLQELQKSGIYRWATASPSPGQLDEMERMPNGLYRSKMNRYYFQDKLETKKKERLITRYSEMHVKLFFLLGIKPFPWQHFQEAFQQLKHYCIWLVSLRLKMESKCWKRKSTMQLTLFFHFWSHFWPCDRMHRDSSA